MKKNIFLSLPYTSSIKNLISDKFLSEFKNCNLIIFSPLEENKNFFFKKLKKFNIVHVKYNNKSKILNLMTFLINNLETIRLLRKKKILTLETFIKMQRNNCTNETIKPFRFLDNSFLKFISYFKYLIFILKLIRLCWIFLSSINYLYFFLKFRPNVFFTAHPYANIDLPLQKIANFFGLKKVALIHSWDNITSKFKMHINYDKILVWNNIQKKQIKYIYEYPNTKIKITGIPFVDDFVHTKKISKHKFFKKNKLDPSKKLITVFGTTEDYIPHIGGILEEILIMINNNELIDKSQIMFRPHPTSKLDYKKIINNKSCFTKKVPNSFIALDYNKIGDYKKEHKFFINMIYHSDLIINFFSTTIIDSIYFDKPIINPLIENNTNRNSCCSVNSYFENWSHMIDITKTNGVSIVRDYKKLKKEINKYLKNKDYKKKNRKKIFNSQINYKLGFSRIAIANEIIN